MRHLASAAQKVLLCLLFSSILGCGGLSIGSESSGDVDNTTTTETQEFGDDAQVNQPEVTVVSGGGATVDASNQPINNNTSDEAVEEGVSNPCKLALWKPISESTGLLVIVGDKKDVIQWSSVSVTVAATGELEFADFDRFTPDGQAWRFDLEGGEYTGVFTIEYSGESCTEKVSDPAERSEPSDRVVDEELEEQE